MTMTRISRLLLLPGVVVSILGSAACNLGANPSSTPPIPTEPGTPAPAYGYYVGMGGYPLITTEPIDSIPANSRVRISHTYFNGTATIYFIVAEDEQRTAEAREDQITYAPDVTPNAPIPTGVYDSFIGMGGYPVVTTEQLDEIPAGTRVRISHSELHYTGWLYVIVAEDERRIASGVRSDQLTLAPDVTFGPTPTLSD
jgi:hypothetical protein